MGTTKIVQALVSPAKKLIEAVSGAIGKAYEPKHIRKVADAKAYELKLISDIVRNNSDVPIVYDSAGVSIDTSNFEEIAKRASSRLAYQEITKQQNIEAVADNAYEELENAEDVSSESTNPDWMFRFFDSVENISNENIQKIWGHILAGEIKCPNTYSFRTLEKLKNMTQQEVECFQKVSSFALRQGGKDFILEDQITFNKYDLNFKHILMLEECGLMLSQNLTLTLSVSINQEEGLYNSKVIGIVRGKSHESQELIIPIYVFTESGSQLLKAVQPQMNSQYFIDYLKMLRERNKDFVFTAHEISYIDDGAKEKIKYNTVDILSVEQT